MKKWSLNKKIALVLVVFGLGAVGISYLGLTKMAFLNGLVNEITSVHVKRDQLTSAIQLEQRQLTIRIRDMIIENELDDIQELNASVQETKKKMLSLLDEFDTIANEKQKELSVQYRAAILKWFAVNDELAALALKNGDNEFHEAHTIIEHKENPVRAEMRGLMTEMNKATADRLLEVIAEGQEAYSMSRDLIFLISAMVIVTTALLAFFIMRALSKSIDQIISNLTDNSNQVTSASQQIASSSEELSQAATEQASSLEETASSIEEMNSMVQRNAENAKGASEVSLTSKNTAEKGKQVVQDMIHAIDDINVSNKTIMDQINTSNQRISEIVQVIAEIGNKTKVINDIVFQTKLLSFNASVEAARAGEHGKGFAVVAEEVGNLAQMSGNAAKEISSMLEDSIKKVEGIVSETKTKVEHLIQDGKDKVETGSRIAKQCGDVLDEIVESVSSVTHMANEISNASQEQAQGVQEITRAMAQLDQVTQTNAATSEEAASAAEELSAQSESLRGVVRTLVETIKGSSGYTVPKTEVKRAAPVAVKAEGKAPGKVKAKPVVKETAKVLPLKPKAKPAKPEAKVEFKKASGFENGSVPSENDPRFEDV